ncbi:hypothetical protein [Methylococcus mesophilus]|uniref:hypothetical protein n=1 Tax=Methylococcus mesophilus TaxID=2993564 RepID=UPI00224B70A7|nr:hypothetical protein [Methylococcus mesophilus]UZR27457.1 hypothetical protein OOT43_12005 [Methylococcus mesophilus]
MAIVEPYSVTLLDQFRALARRLDAAPHRQRGELIQGFLAEHGWADANRVYRGLRKVGWSSGRKTRSDAGSTALDEQVLRELGAAIRPGIRKNGKVTMEVPNAISLMASNGRAIPVGASRVRTLLRRAHLDARSAALDTPHVPMSSLYPNHVHQTDPSLCLLYYAPNGEQRVLRDEEIHRNKPAWVERIGNLKCWRYVLTDHMSSVVIVRYYQAKGETQTNLYDFLLYAWRQLDALGCPFHGVPELLVWDKGSDAGGAIHNALRALQVETWAHARGQARAKGQVECANNIVEKLFESRLKFEPVRNVDELNTAAEAWYRAFNANAIPHYDSRLKRIGLAQPQARYALWQTIRQEQLRTLPDDELCRYLLTAEPEPRKVRATGAGGLTVSFRHPSAKQSLVYDLSGIAGVFRDMTVTVSPLVYGANQVLVTIADYKGDEQTHVIDPVAFEQTSGFRADAPVFGQEFRALRDTPIEEAAKTADRTAYPGRSDEEIEKAKARNAAPFGGLNAHSHLREVYVPEYMKRRGEVVEVAHPVRVAEQILTVTDICARLASVMGRGWRPEYYAAIKDRCPEGAPERELATLRAWLEQPAEAPARPALRAV